MQNSRGLAKQVSLFPPTCGVGLGEFPEIPASEGMCVTQACEDTHDYNVITCRSENREYFLGEVGGLKLDLPLAKVSMDLPTYIPCLDKSTINNPDITAAFPIRSLTLKDIIAKGVYRTAGGLREADEILFHPTDQIASVENDKKLLVFMTGTDTLIEYVWYERYDISLYNTLKQLGCLAIGGFNFSLINGECAFGQMLNLKRSLFSSYEMQQEGLPAIPHVYALTDFQTSQWIKWFEANSSVTHFTVNCQLQKSDRALFTTIDMIKKILGAHPHLHVIVQGYPFDYLSFFGTLLPRIHFADCRPLYNSIHYRSFDVRLDGVLNTVVKKAGIDRQSILIHNLEQRQKQIQAALQKI